MLRTVFACLLACWACLALAEDLPLPGDMAPEANKTRAHKSSKPHASAASQHETRRAAPEKKARQPAAKPLKGKKSAKALAHKPSARAGKAVLSGKVNKRRLHAGKPSKQLRQRGKSAHKNAVAPSHGAKARAHAAKPNKKAARATRANARAVSKKAAARHGHGKRQSAQQGARKRDLKPAAHRRSR